MKCSFCGERIKDGEELCPKCGKYIFEATSTVSVRETDNNAEQITRVDEDEEHSEISVRFNYSEYVRGTVVGYALFSLFFLVLAVLIFLEIIEVKYSYAIISMVVAVVYTCDAVTKYKREKRCFVEINETAVYGTVPSKRSGTATKSFEIELSDIFAVERMVGSKYRDPIVMIETEDETEILYCSSRKMLKKVAEELKKRI